MNGTSFDSREQALQSAQDHCRVKFGKGVHFSDGQVVHNALFAAWGYQVLSQLGENLGWFVVYSRGRRFRWKEVG